MVNGNLQPQTDRRFLLDAGPASHPSVAVSPVTVEGVIVDDDFDVAVQLDDGATDVLAGSMLGYQLIVTNASPTLDVSDVRVRFESDDVLIDQSWICTASAGSVCAPGGSGALDEVVSIEALGQLVYMISATVDPATAPAAGALVATASAELTGPFTDSQPGNNVAVDVDNVVDIKLFFDGFESPPLP
jgi:hypothetical protein